MAGQWTTWTTNVIPVDIEKLDQDFVKKHMNNNFDSITKLVNHLNDPKNNPAIMSGQLFFIGYSKDLNNIIF